MGYHELKSPSINSICPNSGVILTTQGVGRICPSKSANFDFQAWADSSHALRGQNDTRVGDSLNYILVILICFNPLFALLTY